MASNGMVGRGDAGMAGVRRPRRVSTALGLVLLAAVAGGACAPDGGTPESPVVLDLRTDGSRTEFLPDSLVARAGTPVLVRMANEGEIAHNFVLVRDDESVQPIVLAAYQAIATEYVPTGFEEQILASTPLVYPSESHEISFSMPPPGRYTYVCVFPGHGSTMRGTLVSLP